MNQQIQWISPGRGALVAAVIGFVLTYPAVGIVWIVNALTGVDGHPGWLALTLLPAFVGLCASVLTAIGTFTYNAMVGFGLGVVVRIGPDAASQSPSLEQGENEPPDLPVGQYHRF